MKMKIGKLFVWKVICAVLAVLLIASLLSNRGAYGLSKDEAAKKAIDFINANMLQGATAVLKSSEDKNGLYAIKFDIAGQSYDSYVSKDGSLLFPSAIQLGASEASSRQAASQASPQPYPKTGMPKVELFVMSYCPYGMQSEKGIIPVVKLLKNKIDFEVKFVSYAMHPSQGEVQENTRQYCIQKEENSKFIAYIECFLEAGKSEECLAKAAIDMAKLTLCINGADKAFNITENLNDKSLWLNGRYPKFDVQKSDNERYGVQGSPTLIINGEESGAGRDPQSYLAAICAAFNTVPQECSQKLSTETPSAGFGYSGAASNSGSCG